MNSETKTHSTSSVSSTCQNCKNRFAIEREDFDFYKKIGVPPPTWCPECRMQRRMAYRNERSLYRGKDDLGKEIISIFSPDKPFRVYEHKKWWSDDWDPLEYGRDYDFSKPFFAQFRELLEDVPHANVFSTMQVESDYCNHVHDTKNCYLIFASIWVENVSYSRAVLRCRDSMDLLRGEKVELSYELVDCEECSRVFFSRESVGCSDSWFLLNCRNCSDCFGCVNLRNKSYCIYNVQYTKEEYGRRFKELDSGRYGSILRHQEEFVKFAKSFPRKYAYLVNTVNSTGDHLSHTKNCIQCFDLFQDSEDCKYCVHGGAALKDSYDNYGVGAGELMYESIDTGLDTSGALFSMVGRNSRETRYTFSCHGSNNIFGCIGLRNKQYCILNKQYTKEEYEKLVPRIIEHMNEMPYVDSRRRVYKYGEFFPPELSPFAYNETIAQEYFPLTKEQALEKGYAWKEPETRQYTITMTSDQLPDHIRDVDDSILKEVIQCEHNQTCNEQCTQAFKIIPDELQFYRKMNLSLPRLCPNCRHYQRLKQRNPLKLWHRKCQCAIHGHFHGTGECPNEFETSYAPERSEIVYCEQCYNAEVV